jgi:glycosyltransferase involved in cell wall biosynthesis
VNILICNNRYFPSTGPEKYLFAITGMLEAQGHRVIPLAIDWDETVATPYRPYFVPPPIDGQSVYFRQYRDRLTLKNQWRMFAYASYNRAAKAAAARLIAEQQIDLMYVLHTVNMLSPSVIDAAAAARIPVVMRLSDFNLLCPAYIFMRDGQVCTECLGGMQHALRYRCLQHSLPVTAARVLAMQTQKARGIYHRVNAFIAPSRFMADMVDRHFAPARGKVHHIPSFADLADIPPTANNGGYLLFFGRVAPDKGVDWLLQAHARLPRPVPLIIAGEPSDGEMERLQGCVAPHQRGAVQFVGFKQGRDLRDLIVGAIATVQPSRWHDNAPMSVYESLAHGKPVIGSNLGGIAEQITPDCGFLVEPGDVGALAERMQQVIDDPDLAARLGANARLRAATEYSQAVHLRRLLRVFAAVGAPVEAPSA